MHEQLYKQLLAGVFVVEVLCLLALGIALLWLWHGITRLRAGSAGRVPVVLAGALAVTTLLGGAGLAIFGLKGLPWLMDTMARQEAHRQEQTALQEALVGQSAPLLRFTTVADDSPYHLDDFTGEVLLVNFWATWCGPCLREMPDLERLQRDLGARGLKVIHLSDEPREDLTDYLERKSPANLHVYAAGTQWPAYALPTTYVIDREGIIRGVRTGMSDYAEFAGMVEPHL